MTRSINVFFSMLFLACLCVVAGLYPKIGLAQVEPDNAYFNVLRLDRENFPMVELTLAGGEIATDAMAGEFIQSADVEIIEDGIAQPILEDRVEESVLQLAVVVDPRTLTMQGASGQPRYLEMVGLVLKLIASSSDDSVMADEQFAALVADQSGGIKTIQAWTEDPEQIFKSIMKQRSDIVLDDGDDSGLILDSLLAASDTFLAADTSTGSTKAVLLFSAGLDGDDLSDAALEQIAMQLRAAQIQLYVAQFASSGQLAVADESLSRLSSATNGYLVELGEETDLDGLFHQLEETRYQRVVSYNSEQLSPNEISIQLALADGGSLAKQVDGTGELLGSNPAATLAPTVEPSDVGVDGSTSDGSSDAITIPGTEISISRNAIFAALAVLLALLAYFLFSDARARRAENKRQAKLQSLYETGEEEYPKHHNFIRSQRGTDVMQKASAEVNDAGDDKSYLEESYLHESDLDGLLQQADDTLQASGYDLVDEDTVVKTFVLQESVVQESVEESLVELSDKHEVDEHEAAVEAPVVEEPKVEEPVAKKPIEEEPSVSVSTIQEIIENEPAIVMSPQQRNHIDAELPTFDTMVSKAQPPRRVAPRAGASGNEGTSRKVSAAEQNDDILRLQPNMGAMSILGYFIRVTDEPNLPLRLPLYKIDSTDDEAMQVQIGRNGQVNSIVINAKRVSREHAIVVQKKGRLYLRDNNSTTGTFLNWQRLNKGEEVMIRDNDLVGFGDVSYEFRLQGEQKGAGLIL